MNAMAKWDSNDMCDDGFAVGECHYEWTFMQMQHDTFKILNENNDRFFLEIPLQNLIRLSLQQFQNTQNLLIYRHQTNEKLLRDILYFGCARK